MLLTGVTDPWITVDAGELDHDVLLSGSVGGPVRVSAGGGLSLRLPPGRYLVSSAAEGSPGRRGADTAGHGLPAAGLVVQVRPGGRVDYPVDCAAVFGGAGTATLSLVGHAVLVDARRTDTELVGIGGCEVDAANKRVVVASLLPAAYRIVAAGGTVQEFVLHLDGSVTVSDSADGVVVRTVPSVTVLGPADRPG